MAESSGADARRFSFLVDQEYQREREEKAAANKPKYTAGWKDYAIFLYFCTNVAVIGNPLLNSNAVLRVWKNSDMFKPENPSQLLVGWSDVQMLSSKTALLLAHGAIAGSGMMGGVLVDTFSASMCLLVAHLMYGAGAYFFRSDTSREVFMGAVLQGVAGELLLNSVLPICALFGDRQYIMLLVLTFCGDLSVLIYPVLLRFFAPDTPITAIHEEYYKDWHHATVYYAWLAAVVGTFILPVDDNGNLMPVTKSAGGLESANRVPPGLLRGPNDLRGTGRLEDPDPRDLWNEEQPPSFAAAGGSADEDDEVTEALIARYQTKETGGGWKGSRLRKPVSLWGLRFTKKLRSIQFFLCCLLFACCVFRNSFYLNNNAQLLEAVGDNGTLSSSFMWLMGLGAAFGPLSWHLNDKWKSLVSLSVLLGVNLAITLLTMVECVHVQWLTLVLIVFARSSTLPTLLTYTAGVFGLRHFPAISVLVALTGGFANFLHVFVDRFTEKHWQGDYLRMNKWLMLSVSAFSFLLLFCQWLYPTINEPEAADNDDHAQQSEILREAVRSVNANVRGAGPLTRNQLVNFAQH